LKVKYPALSIISLVLVTNKISIHIAVIALPIIFILKYYLLDVKTNQSINLTFDEGGNSKLINCDLNLPRNVRPSNATTEYN